MIIFNNKTNIIMQIIIIELAIISQHYCDSNYVFILAFQNINSCNPILNPAW